MRTQIFISYRRDGGLDTAKALCEALTEKYEVFFDMNSLRNGRFDEAIEKAITECSDFLLILSPNIFDRYFEPDDWISRELRLALDNSKNVIPIFLDDFTPPKTDDENIEKAMKYNGLRYGSEGFFDKIKQFIVSNERCVLDIECSEEGYFLSDNAIDALKAAYRAIRESEKYDIEVKLNLPDINTASELLNRKYLGQDNYQELLNFTVNRLIRKHHRRKEIIETAVTYMLADRSNIYHAPKALPNPPSYAHGVFSAHGNGYNYFPVAAWERVINELLKEFTLLSENRTNYYRTSEHRSDYYYLDIVINRASNKKRGQWYFHSFAKTIEEMPCAHYPLMQPSLFTIDDESFFSMVLPDFYYSAALAILMGPDELKAEFLDPESPIRFLANYWYGLS